MLKLKKFKQIIRDSQFLVISGESGSGLTTFLLNTCSLLSDKKAVFFYLDNYPPNTNNTNLHLDNLKMIANGHKQSIQSFKEKINQSVEEYDLIIIDEIEHLLINEGSNYVQEYFKLIKFLKGKSDKTQIIFSMRLRYESLFNSINTVLDNHFSIKKRNDIFDIKIIKSKCFLSEQIKISFKLDKFNMFDNQYFEIINYFNNYLKFENNNFSPVFRKHLEQDFKDVFSYLSNKQRIKLWYVFSSDKMIEIFKIKKVKNHNINTTYLHYFLLLNYIYKDFNLDYFLYYCENSSKLEKQDFSFLDDKYLKVFYLFFSENFSFKKSVHFLFNIQNCQDIEYLKGITIAYFDIKNNIKYNIIKNNIVEIKDLQNFKKKINNKKNIKNLYLFIENICKIIEILKDKNSEIILKEKKAILYSKMKGISLRNYNYLIPETILDLNKFGQEFDNCLKSGYFIDKFKKDNSFIIILKNSKNPKKDLCLHFDRDNIIELKRRSNEKPSPQDIKYIEDFFLKIKSMNN